MMYSVHFQSQCNKTYADTNSGIFSTSLDPEPRYIFSKFVCLYLWSKMSHLVLAKEFDILTDILMSYKYMENMNLNET